MDPSSSAYAALGLEPGADAQAIERAYKTLIKQFHPDRNDGDSARAAEINRAYSELRGRRQVVGVAQPSETLADAIYRRQARSKVKAKRRRWMPWWPILAGGLTLVALARSDAALEGLPRVEAWAIAAARQVLAPVTQDPSTLGERSNEPDPSMLDQPLDSAAIDYSIDKAVRLLRSGDREALADWSRDCHKDVRERPSVALLDRCAAFDNAVVAIAGSDPILDRGPFSASAITARQMGAAALLSDDHIAIEARLDGIRARVEASLAPPPAAAPIPRHD